MTPEEFAIAAACGACMHHQPCMARRADLFRAALRERDAAWNAAVRVAGAVIAKDGSIFLMPGGDYSPLRALLEEAGK